MGFSPRQAFLADIAPHFPTVWKVLPYMANLDTLSETTVVFHMTGIEKSAAAPMGAYDIEFSVYVVSPYTDPERGEDDTDDSFVEFVAALDSAGIPWTRAEKGPFSEATPNLAWKFTIPFTAVKETD